jgi:hypothetical protein
MWRDLLTEKDRKWLQAEADKEPHMPGVDDMELEGIPTDDVEIRNGSAGRQLHRCFYRWGAVGMWERLKGVTNLVAIVDLAYEHGFIHESMQRRLLEALGTRPARRPPSKLPVWNREEKILRFEGTIIRRIRSLKVASNIVAILDHFQASGWRSSIPNPLEAARPVPSDTIYSLNDGLKKIAFHVCNDGESISWSRR